MIDVRGIDELHAVSDANGSVVLGSCITHAAIEDGKVPDVTRGLMREVAANIAYRAVRNRGTIGGSLCHADPAADWVSVLTLLSAVALIEGPGGRREVDLEHFVTGAFSTVLAENEILVALRIPKLSPPRAGDTTNSVASPASSPKPSAPCWSILIATSAGR